MPQQIEQITEDSKLYDVPFCQVAKFKVMPNLKMAKALGFDITVLGDRR
jgi:hypothetical protein